MTYLQNLHTHCTYCDGKNTPEQIIKKAIEIGFNAVGFSSHAPLGFETDYAIKEEKLDEYISVINGLKKKYEEQINVFCGLEADYFSIENDSLDFDYKIGSVHLLEIGGKFYDVDENLQKTKYIINEFFNGDGIEYAKSYFELVSKLADVKNFDIVGHFDLVTKFNEKEFLINTNSKAYRDLALEAVHSLKGKVTAFEVNTGAISRNHRTTPYPAPFLLKELCKIGEKVILTSDCHNMDYLDTGYKDAIEIIKNCGFKSIVIKNKTGFEEVALD